MQLSALGSTDASVALKSSAVLVRKIKKSTKGNPPESESFEVFVLCNFFCLKAFTRSKTWGSVAVHWVKCHSCWAKMHM